MAKLASAEEVIELIKSGKYASKTNAQRGAGRTRISKPEKDKVFAFINSYFPDDGSAPAKPSKKVGKKASKKVAKKAVAKAAVAKPAAAPKPEKQAKKVTKKKVVRQARQLQADDEKSSETPEGTLPISPSQVSTVADILKLVDSTVNKSVSIMNALQRVKEFGTEADISEGVTGIKDALTGAARILNQSVIAPLTKVAATKSDPEVTQRLEQVATAAAAVPSLAPPLPSPPPMPENHQSEPLQVYAPPPAPVASY